jgi:alpha-tubulin suppressor-like RCC1 family protein
MTVYAWGRGEHGQLGRKVPVFVGDTARSDVLSSARALVGVVAVANCSATVDKSGTIVLTAGKCSGLRKRLEAAAAALLLERAELRTLG